MSGKLAGKIWDSALDPKLKPIAAALADIGDDFGRNIYPSIPYVAWCIGNDQEPSDNPRMKRTVIRGIKELRMMGVLVHVGYRRRGRHVNGQGPATTNEYRLDESALPKRPAWREQFIGDNLSPLETALGVTNRTSKGDKTSSLGVTKSTSRGDTGVTQTVREPLVIHPEPQSPMDAPPLHLPSNVSASSDQPREIFISPGPEEALEIPEPDWSAGDLPAGLRLVSSRFCDDCGEAFVQVISETICPACVDRFVAAARRK